MQNLFDVNYDTFGGNIQPITEVIDDIDDLEIAAENRAHNNIVYKRTKSNIQYIARFPLALRDVIPDPTFEINIMRCLVATDLLDRI